MAMPKITRVLLWCAFRPNEEISSRHIAVLFGIPARAVCQHLSHHVRNGVLARQVRDGQAWYRAGPEMVNEVRNKHPQPVAEAR